MYHTRTGARFFRQLVGTSLVESTGMSTHTARLSAMLLFLCGVLTAAEPGSVTFTVEALDDDITDSVTLSNGTDRVMVRVLKPNLLQVDYRPSNQTSPNTLIIDPDFASKGWSANATIANGASEVVLTTSAMVVKVSKSGCRINVYQTDGTTRIFGEPSGGGMSDSRVKVEFDSGINWYGIQSAPGTRGRDMGDTSMAAYSAKVGVTASDAKLTGRPPPMSTVVT